MRHLHGKFHQRHAGRKSGAEVGNGCDAPHIAFPTWTAMAQASMGWKSWDPPHWGHPRGVAEAHARWDAPSKGPLGRITEAGMGQVTPCLDHAGKIVGAGVDAGWVTPFSGCCGKTVGTGLGSGHCFLRSCVSRSPKDLER